MMNRVRVQTRIEVKTAPQASLGLKTLARMLTLNSEELLKLIEQELEENPALEATDEERIRVIAPQPPTLSLDADSSAFSEESDSDDWLEMRLATPPMDLKAHVLGQLRLMVAPRLIPIAEHLVESLDSYGYLRTDVEEVALYLNAPLEDVEYALEQLQGCDPPGVGARDLLFGAVDAPRGRAPTARVLRRAAPGGRAYQRRTPRVRDGLAVLPVARGVPPAAEGGLPSGLGAAGSVPEQ